MIIKPKHTRILTPEGMMAKKVEYESVTSLQRATQCLAEYWEHYKRTWREPANARTVFGRALHDTCEEVMVEKMHNGYLLPEWRVFEIFEMYWTLEMRDSKERGLVWADALSPQQMVAKAKALLNLWLTQHAPNLQPREAEMPFWLELTGCKRALYGRVDLCLENDGGGLLDYKTSRTTWVPDLDESQKLYKTQTQVRFQMHVYHAGWYGVYKTWPAWAELVRFLTGNSVAIERIDVHATEEEVQETLDTIVKPTIQRIEDAWAKDEWPCTCGRHTGDRGNTPPAGTGKVLADAGAGSPPEDPHAGHPAEKPTA